MGTIAKVAVLRHHTKKKEEEARIEGREEAEEAETKAKKE
jgi:hypothetical protein